MMETHSAAAGALPQTPTSGQAAVSVGVMAVIALLTMSFGIRMAALGQTPLTEAEIAPALSAFRSVFPSTLDPEPTNSPIIFAAQRLAYSLIGADEFSARLLTALVGTAVCALPLLFGGLLGQARAFILALLLTFSPTMIAAARLNSGMTWAVFFAGLGLWGAWRAVDAYREQNTAGQSERGSGFAVFAAIAFGGMVLLAEPGGAMLGVILLAAGAVATLLSALDAPSDKEEINTEFLAGTWPNLASWPWQSSLVALVVFVLIMTTGFMLYPAGLANVGELLGQFFGGFFHSSADRPLFFPLLNSLFYDTWLWVLGVAAAIVLSRSQRLTLIERFFIFWLLFAGFAAVLYQDGTAAHALWFTVPLAGLAAHLIADALERDDLLPLWLESVFADPETRVASARAARWILGLLMLALLTVAALHLQILARGVLKVGDGSLSSMITLMWNRSLEVETRSFIWAILTLLFIAVGYMLAASIWGNRTTLQGAILGITAFALITGAAAGWNLTNTNADDPIEPWHQEATAPDALLLRETLLDFSTRSGRGFPILPAAAMAPSDGILAWELRDFENARFTTTVEETRGSEIIILPATFAAPDLGGNYVGQPMDLTRRWSGALSGLDILPWWVVRRARFPVETAQAYVLWVRQDVYNGQRTR